MTYHFHQRPHNHDTVTNHSTLAELADLQSEFTQLSIDWRHFVHTTLLQRPVDSSLMLSHVNNRNILADGLQRVKYTPTEELNKGPSPMTSSCTESSSVKPKANHLLNTFSLIISEGTFNLWLPLQINGTMRSIAALFLRRENLISKIRRLQLRVQLEVSEHTDMTTNTQLLPPCLLFLLKELCHMSAEVQQLGKEIDHAETCLKGRLKATPMSGPTPTIATDKPDKPISTSKNIIDVTQGPLDLSMSKTQYQSPINSFITSNFNERPSRSEKASDEVFLRSHGVNGSSLSTLLQQIGHDNSHVASASVMDKRDQPSQSEVPSAPKTQFSTSLERAKRLPNPLHYRATSMPESYNAIVAALKSEAGVILNETKAVADKVVLLEKKDSEVEVEATHGPTPPTTLPQTPTVIPTPLPTPPIVQSSEIPIVLAVSAEVDGDVSEIVKDEATTQAAQGQAVPSFDATNTLAEDRKGAEIDSSNLSLTPTPIEGPSSSVPPDVERLAPTRADSFLSSPNSVSPPKRKQVTVRAPGDDIISSPEVSRTLSSPPIPTQPAEPVLASSTSPPPIMSPNTIVALVAAVNNPMSFNDRLRAYGEALVAEGVWSVHQKEGTDRIYYSNKKTKETVWDLTKTLRKVLIDLSVAVLLEQKLWVLVAKEGTKPYYYNKGSKETCWDLAKWVESH